LASIYHRYGNCCFCFAWRNLDNRYRQHRVLIDKWHFPGNALGNTKRSGEGKPHSIALDISTGVAQLVSQVLADPFGLSFFLFLASLKQLSRIPCCDVNEDNARRFNLLCVGVCIAASRLLLVFALFNWKLNKCPGSRLIVWPTVLRDFGPDGGHLSRAIVVVPGPIVRLISFTSRKPLAHKDSHCCGLVIRPFYGGNNGNQPEKSI